MMRETCRLVIVSGPTAVGKSAVALDLARHLGMEIVNADSLQVYRGLDIGTAKPTAAERGAVPHHLIDIRDPDEPFDAARFSAAADRVIGQLMAAGRVPLVVGGTGLYIRALVYGLCDMPPIPPVVRHRVHELLRREGVDGLHRAVAAADPEMARRLAPRDQARLARALEVRWATGRSIAAFQQSHRFAVPRYDVLHLCLVREREELYERIARRTAAMLAAGLVEEMRALIAQGYDPSLKPLQSIGYRQVGEYLAGRLPREALAAEISRATRRYAKRQLTWFRHARGVTLLAPESWDAIASRIERFLGHPVSRGGDARKERHR